MLHLTVRDFSCIKHAELDISNLTVIIGEQSSGKSLLAKLVYFLGGIQNNVVQLMDGGFSHDYYHEIRKYIVSNFYRYFDKDSLGDKSFEIIFTSDNLSIEFSKKDIDALIPLLTKSEKPSLSDSTNITIKHKYQSQPKSIFIPAGRAFFVNRSQSADVFMAEHQDITLTLFGRIYASFMDGFYKKRKSDYVEYFLSKLDNKNKFVLKGQAIRENNNVFIQHDDGRKVNLVSSSSGQKELYPLLVAFDLMYNFNYYCGIVEEPETHLFPTTQGIITKFIAELSMMQNNHYLFVTTHSPYILSQLNSLLKAGRLAEQFKDDAEKLKQIEAIIPREYWLPRANVNVYKMEDGKNHQLIDEEDGIIDETYLDSVSEIIMEEYYQLSKLENSYEAES